MNATVDIKVMGSSPVYGATDQYETYAYHYEWQP
jgi:hypothetical protein